MRTRLFSSTHISKIQELADKCELIESSLQSVIMITVEADVISEVEKYLGYGDYLVERIK